MSGAGIDIGLLRAQAVATGFDASLEDSVGELLTVLAASKPAGRLLELGTGVGVGTAYLLRGADADSTLVTVERDARLTRLAQQLIVDDRVEWVVGDAGQWLAERSTTGPFDLIFADTWPGKFTDRDRAISLLGPGGLFVVDDLLPQPNWPDEHQARVDDLVAALAAHPQLAGTQLTWASGVMVCSRTST